MKDLFRNWRIQIKKGYLDLCILSFIHAKEKTYGFEIISLLKDIEIQIKDGTLYPLLNRMTKDGLLKAKWDTKNVNGHPKKYYSLTRIGKEQLFKMEVDYKNLFLNYKKIETIGGKYEQQKTQQLSH